MSYKKTTMCDVSSDQLSKDLVELGSFRKIGLKYNVGGNTVIYHFKKRKLAYKNKIRNYGVNDSFFSQENYNEESFYWAGFLAADGCISIRKNFNGKNIILNLAEKDISHLEKFKKAVSSNHPIKKYIVKNSKINANWSDRPMCKITIGSHKIVGDLARFNIVSRKTKIYDLPDWIINHHLLNHFLRGYFDGDGNIWIHKRKNMKDQYKMSLAGNYSFLNNVGDFICNNLNITNKSINYNGGVYVLSYGGNNLTKKVGSYLYNNSNIFLERKHSLWKDCFNL